MSEAEAPAVRFLPQLLQEEANSAPADVSGAVCGLGSSWRANEHLLLRRRRQSLESQWEFPAFYAPELLPFSSLASVSPSSGIPVRSEDQDRNRPSGFLSEDVRFLRIWLMMTSRGERL